MEENTNLNQDEETIKSANVCPKCGTPLDDSQNFCSKCGTPKNALKKNVCGNCGAELLDGQEFCTNCGKEVQHKRKKRILPIIISCVGALLVLFIIGFVLYFAKENIRNNNEEAQANKDEIVSYISNAEMFWSDAYSVGSGAKRTLKNVLENWSYMAYRFDEISVLFTGYDCDSMQSKMDGVKEKYVKLRVIPEDSDLNEILAAITKVEKDVKMLCGEVSSGYLFTDWSNSFTSDARMDMIYGNLDNYNEIKEFYEEYGKKFEEDTDNLSVLIKTYKGSHNFAWK